MAASDPNTIMFRWKSQTAFEALYTWLRGVVAFNLSNNVDCAAALVDPPVSTGRESVERNSHDTFSASVAPDADPGERVVDAGESASVSGVTDFRTAPPPSGPAIVLEDPQADRPAKLDRRERSKNREAFESLAMAAAYGDADALRDLPGALEETRDNWRGSKLQSILWQVLATAIQHVGADDVLTVEEEGHLVGVAHALGLTFDGLRFKAPAAFEELVICRINDGRPPTLDDAPIIIKRAEVAYGSFSVSLMKEVVRREFRGGSSGVSIPVGFGIRYRTGSVRGRSVVVGTDLVAEDTGTLVVTSTRSVFVGSKKTLEFRHDRLVGVQQYTDGLRLNVTNRQAASLFKFAEASSPTIATALIVHAASAF